MSSLILACAVIALHALAIEAAPTAQADQPKVLQYVIEAVVDLPNWKHYLPDDIDTDNDGTLSEREVEQQFKSYMREAFDKLDQDGDKLITQHEFRSARIDLPGINRIIDIAFQSWPLKPFLFHGDRNQDGFIAEDDLLSPENEDAINKEHATEPCIGVCDYENEKDVEDLSEKYGDAAEFLQVLEVTAPYLLIADTNGDEKVSIDELKAKVKDISGAVFQVVDQTNDGFVSVKDGTSINLRLESVLDLVMKLFEIICKKTGEEAEVNLVKDELLGGGLGLGSLDQNLDGIANLKDFYKYLDEARPAQVVSLVGIVARNLDFNQDGKIQYGELKNYLRLVFKNIDSDNNDAITLGDVYKLMYKSQFTCLQMEGVQTFVGRAIEYIEAGIDKMLAYFFTEFDLDGNGQIPLEEFYNAHVPCDEERKDYSDYSYRGRVENSNDSYSYGPMEYYPDYSYRDGPPILEDPNRHRCNQLEMDFFSEEYPRFPILEYDGDHHSEYGGGYGGGYDGGYGGPSRYGGGSGGRKQSLEEKLANSACIAMQSFL